MVTTCPGLHHYFSSSKIKSKLTGLFVKKNGNFSEYANGPNQTTVLKSPLISLINGFCEGRTF